jgi:hypothetical protein
VIDSQEYLLFDADDCTPLAPIGGRSTIPQVNVADMTSHTGEQERMPLLFDNYGRRSRKVMSRMVSAPNNGRHFSLST